MRYAVAFAILAVAAAAIVGYQLNGTAGDTEPGGKPKAEADKDKAAQKDKPAEKGKAAAKAKPDGKAKPVAKGKPGGEEPLLLLEEAPLLLDDGAGTPAGPVADNARCHVCHLNYITEDLAVVHAKANIGCAKCHGESDAHIADESWANNGNGTAPEIMYPKDKINPACQKCHPQAEVDEDEHADFFAGVTKEKVCTDCHGKHRLTERKCKWK